ncbi:hypothetical protein ASD56_14775 [Microbacterium sp. Root166]|uniref:hypothetical protein n=1 Tax=Microbacterium sp. Root166 TaxID=1736478 RepID=UPI0006F21AB6|nr:hypothetical protein [Microbacterium sp. Root166]KQZ82145.1 hypothetical protein ASD56_14775 [Microbacterium sp. Root166]
MSTSDLTPPVHPEAGSPPTPPPPPAVGPTPPTGAVGQVPPAAPGQGSSAGRTIAILAAALGGLVAVVTIGGAAIATVDSANSDSVTRTLDVDGITELDIEAAAGTLDVAFGDVDEAVLDISSGPGRGDWTFDSDGDTLTLATPDRGWFDNWLLGGWGSGSTRATLTLPQSLEGRLDAGFSLAAGRLTVDGEFGEVELVVAAGDLAIEGSADELSADVSAGRAEVELDGVSTADLTVQAGAMVARFTGTAPTATVIDVSAGSLDLRVPEGAYDVNIDSSAGNVRNDLESSSSSDNVIEVSISAGSVSLRAE